MAVTPANRSQRCETAEAIGQVVMVADENPPGPQLSPQQKSVMPNTSVEGLLSLQIRLTVAKTSSPHHGMAVQRKAERRFEEARYPHGSVINFALALLVRVASRFRRNTNESTIDVAPVRRTKMDRRKD